MISIEDTRATGGLIDSFYPYFCGGREPTTDFKHPFKSKCQILYPHIDTHKKVEFELEMPRFKGQKI